ncbi:craniofacial development protein 1 [Bombus affinis]|uniref:Craniofacial development protein 1 n=1 Tax=Bombus terrestris TaxID=30195 RepID=A0A9B2JGL1_BOMTE|nr:craniofacial development protein 1 [Bombus terrestris]XP_012166009.1 craniofacial development protein 1 [Bombus terrestris]XP_050575896.1 craniofacial development protein 1 [Bombus affinis]XP_050575911.1 craniofacial development protein 1 [Bombus affinis]
MTEEHQLPSDSDEDDEDYVPDGADSEPVSEVESEGDAESGPEDENDENKRETTKRRGRKKKVIKSKIKKHRRTRKKVEDEVDEKLEEEEVEKGSKEKKQLTEEEEKKRADSLWADFMKDTATVPKSKPQSASNKSKEKSPPIEKPKVEEKVKITKVFEFAGEEVKVEKEVSIDSAEARLSLSSAENSEKTGNPGPPAGRGSGRGKGFKRAGLGGISSVLGQLGKKTKISTLEKSKLDWDNYKKQENLEEEISTHNKGKDGYLERQDFLQRADLRQFEIEKQLRNANRRSTR